jgi:hypothetical protein
VNRQAEFLFPSSARPFSLSEIRRNLFPRLEDVFPLQLINPLEG